MLIKVNWSKVTKLNKGAIDPVSSFVSSNIRNILQISPNLTHLLLEITINI